MITVEERLQHIYRKVESDWKNELMHAMPDKDEAFRFRLERALNAGHERNSTEADRLAIRKGIDVGLRQVSYRWFYYMFRLFLCAVESVGDNVQRWARNKQS
jgi:hypothetical protein